MTVRKHIFTHFTKVARVHSMHKIISMHIMPSDGLDPKLQFYEEKSYLYHKV